MIGTDILWLALCIFYEARGEPLEGQLGVAHVVLNRSINRQLTIEEVIKQSHQFSWYNENFKVRTVFKELKSYFDCVYVVYKCAEERQEGKTFEDANYFFNPKYANPSWAKEFTLVKTVGNHSFYRGK
jgi:spore germination cell wall hydrolase CwlJ-like protein